MSLPVRGTDTARDTRRPLLGLDTEELATVLADHVDRRFRVRQIHDALYRRAVRDFGAMTDLAKDTRARLAEEFTVGMPEVAERHASADGTVKYLLRMADGASVEAVDIPDGDRRTFCISSQAGCGLACKFCVTGFWGPGRSLTAGEIVGQVLAIRHDQSLPPTGFNLVFMGMGEPLQNTANVKKALDLLTEHLAWKRITVSTAGVIAGIDAMAAWPERPNLAISLHAPDDERRSDLMPINRSQPLGDLLAALRRFPLEKGRKITIEYILIRGFNDSVADADSLASRLAGLDAKVNLIPINPDPVLGDAMVPPSDAVVDAFQERLRRHGWIATVRRRRGDDVSAACGQLRAFARDPRGFPERLHGNRQNS